ncbi:MAG: hypothetical protein KAR38_02485 [Calditrichia bacterium]|nr:hypothetical protein [Calditrichia bacterium]
MKKIFIFLLILQSFLWGQESDSIPTFKNALQFQVGSEFRLSSFQGTLISYQRILGENRALRVGISGSFIDENHNSRSTYLPADTSFNEVDTENYDTDFDFYLQYIFYKKSYSDIRFFYGAGPMVGVSKGNSDREVNYNGNIFYSIKDKSSGWSAGINGLCGVEWQLRKNVFLSAEYRNLFYYTKRKNERKRTFPDSEEIDFDVIKSDGFRLSSQNIIFGVSVYF